MSKQLHQRNMNQIGGGHVVYDSNSKHLEEPKYEFNEAPSPDQSASYVINKVLNIDKL